MTGKRYSDVVWQRILEPLGLSSTDPAIANEGRARLAVGYEPLYDDRPARRGDPWVPAAWLETGTGDGALAGTMEDLAAFVRALLNGGRSLLEPESFELLSTPAIEADDGWWSGPGLELRERDGRREIRHGGSMPGFRAMMLGDLDSGVGVAVAVNAGDESDVADDVATVALDLFREGTGPRPSPIRSPSRGRQTSRAGTRASRPARVRRGRIESWDKSADWPRRSASFPSGCRASTASDGAESPWSSPSHSTSGAMRANRSRASRIFLAEARLEVP